MFCRERSQRAGQRPCVNFAPDGVHYFPQFLFAPRCFNQSVAATVGGLKIPSSLRPIETSEPQLARGDTHSNPFSHVCILLSLLLPIAGLSFLFFSVDGVRSCFFPPPLFCVFVCVGFYSGAHFCLLLHRLLVARCPNATNA